MKKSRRLSTSTILILIFALSFLAMGTAAAMPATSPQGQLLAAWELAGHVGEFDYSTRVQQTVRPLPTLGNAGLSNAHSQFYIEGQNNIREQTLQMRIWGQGDNVLNTADALEMRVADGRTMGRIGDSEWEEVDDISSLMAPGQDSLGFLIAAENVEHLGQEVRAEFTFDRYSFTINGPKFAEFMRDQFEEEMRRNGSLPPGISLDVARQYADMEGAGELWIQQNGLPLRLSVDLIFPPDETEQLDYTFTTDFTGWDQSVAAQAATIQGRLAFNGTEFIRQAGAIVALLLGAAGTALFLMHLGWRRIYKPILTTMVLIMVFSPVIQAGSIHAAESRHDPSFADQSNHSAGQTAVQSNQQVMQAINAGYSPSVDPLAGSAALTGSELLAASPLFSDLALPLAQDEDSLMDSDGDGLTDDLEGDLGTNPLDSDSDDDDVTDLYELLIGDSITDPNDADSDGDGLSDGIELLKLGLDPLEADSDADQIDDLIEVSGFLSADGQRLYLNPQQPDSNNDGLFDGVECPALIGAQSSDITCPDSDGDGEPDVLDFDNDGDGVPDSVDSSPNSVLSGGLKSNNCLAGYDCHKALTETLKLNVSDYTVGEPLLVDMQIRPENPTHLWQAMNVLDWPDQDNEGQITTGANTFANSGTGANGDMRLTPLVQIKIPFENGNYPGLPKIDNAPPITVSTPITAWLDVETMSSFGISLRKLDDQGTLAAYVPPVMTPSPIDGSPVAFQARMFYAPDAANWGSDHEVSLVWMVELLNPENVGQIIHVYEENIFLASLLVREDLGGEAAVIYEKADRITNPGPAADYYEKELWGLAGSLSDTFMGGRTDVNGMRDITVQEIAYRFDDLTNNGWVTDTNDVRLWGVDPDALRVNTVSYDHEGEIAVIPNEINQVLTDTFLSLASTDVYTTPLFLIAREETARIASLPDGLTTNSNSAISLANVPTETFASMLMAARTYDALESPLPWKTLTPDQYWIEHLRDRSEADLQTAVTELLGAEDVNEEAQIGFEAFAFTTVVALFSGLTNLVERDIPVPAQWVSTDGALAAEAVANGQAAGGYGKTITTLILKQIIIKAWWEKGFDTETKNVAKYFGANDIDDLRTFQSEIAKRTVTRIDSFNQVKKAITNHKIIKAKLVEIGGSKDVKSFLKNKTFLGKAKTVEVNTDVAGTAKITKVKYGWNKKALGFTGLLATGVQAGLVGLHVALVGKGNATLGSAMAVVGSTVDFAQQSFTIASTIQQISNASRIAGSASGGVKLLATKLTNVSKVTAVIGVIIEIGVTVAFFVKDMASQGGYSGAVRSNRLALGTLISAIIVAIILAIIGAIPGIGILIVAIIGAIDALVALICSIKPPKEENEVGNFLCGGITGALTALVNVIIYDNTPVVQLDHDFILETQTPDLQLVDLSAGFTAGNQVDISLPARVQLFKEGDFGTIAGIAGPFWATDKKTKRTTYSVEFVSSEDVERADDLNKGDNSNDWIATGNSAPAFVGQEDERETNDPKGEFYRDLTAVGRGDMLLTGANQPLSNIYLSIAYAVPTLECGVIACWEITTRDTINVDPEIKLDILPATFEEFLQLQIQPIGGADGHTFAWSGDGLPFPTFRDGDGDGLISQARGGNDPDDSQWDTDGDGLSDFFEVQNGYDPRNADTDFDGLRDGDEVIQGTNPTLADTDSDGLTDADEVYRLDRSSGDWVGGWNIIYDFNGTTPLETRVFSNPTEPNVDGDSYSDKLESVYGFHPEVPTNAEILSIETQVDEILFESTAGRTCKTIILNTLTITDAVRDDAEPQEFNDAEIAVLLDGTRVWSQEALGDGSSATLGISYPFCDREVTLEIIEVDQGDWNNDPIGELTITTGTTSFNQTFVSSMQGSEVVLDATISDYNDATVPVASPTDGFVAPGQQLLTTSTVENKLNNRNALGLLDATFSATEPGSSTLFDQPFILPPNQQTIIGGQLQVEDSINSSQVVSLTTTAGALVNPTFDFNTLGQVYTPTLYIPFDGTNINGYLDESPNNIAITVPPAIDSSHWVAPEAEENGRIAEAVRFEQGNYMQVANNSELVLADNDDNGSFTIATWIKPNVTGEDPNSQPANDPKKNWRAISGAGSGQGLDFNNAYPTFMFNAWTNELGIGFGNGSASCIEWSGNPVISQDVWQHVAVTYDATTGTGAFYKDGELVAGYNCGSAILPSQQSGFWLGRASEVAVFTWLEIDSNNSGEATKAEYIFQVKTAFATSVNYDLRPSSEGGDVVFQSDKNALGRDDDPLQVNHTVVFGDTAMHYYLCENDPDVDDSGCQGGDDRLFGSRRYNNGRPGFGQITWCCGTPTGSGSLNWVFPNNTLHVGSSAGAQLFGETTLDDYYLFKDALPRDAIRDLILGAETTLQLRLDEPPGAAVQYDFSGNRFDGTCEGSSCPLTGVNGRSNQAAQFDGVNDFVTLANTEQLGLDDGDFTIATWIRREPNSGGVIIENDNTDTPFRLIMTPDGDISYRFGDTNSSFWGPKLPANEWHHVAFVRENNAFKLYIDGVQFSSGTVADPDLPTLPNVPLYLGAAPSVPDSYLNGAIDQVTIRPAALPQADIQALIAEAPITRLPFDDDLAATSLDDLASDSNVACSGNNCPDKGVDGQLYSALSFDGVNDRVVVTGTNDNSNESFTISLWVRPDQTRAEDQNILNQAGLLPQRKLQMLLTGDNNATDAGKLAYAICSNTDNVVTSNGQLLTNAWNHIALAFDKEAGMAQLYINGSPDGTAVSFNSCNSLDEIVLGEGSLGSVNFRGDMDEFAIYGAAFSDRDVRGLFDYQVAWFDASDILPLVVDADAPVASIDHDANVPVGGDETVIALSASDINNNGVADSGIALVEYMVSGSPTQGNWTAASQDGAAWLFNLDAHSGSGSYTIMVRATDAVGNVSAVASKTLTVDITNPSVSLDGSNPVTVIDETAVELAGSATDNTSVQDVRAEIIDHDGSTVGGQVSAALNGSSWTATYPTNLPLYGTYDVEMVAVDTPGNVFTKTETVEIDQTGPVAYLTQLDDTEGVIAGIDSDQPTIYGTAADIPYISGEAFRLQFEESTFGTLFYDSSVNRNHSSCTDCPTADASGAFGQAASFDGSTQMLMVNNAPFGTALEINGTVTLAAWVKLNSTTGTQTIVGRGSDVNNNLFLRLNGGSYEAGVVNDGTAVTAASAIPNGDVGVWVHLAATFDGQNWVLYRNGEEVGNTESTQGVFVAGNSWTIGGSAFGSEQFSGSIDEVIVHDRAFLPNSVAMIAEPVSTSSVATVEVGLLHLSQLDVPLGASVSPTQTVELDTEAVDVPVDVVWYPATVTNLTAPYSTWSWTVPEGLEGPYRIYLRTVDASGNITSDPYIWQGEIDTQAPTAVLNSWDRVNKRARYSCDVSDYNLDLNGITCVSPMPDLPLDLLEYQDADWFTTLFPGTQKLSRAATSGGFTLPDRPQPFELTACDLYGNCTTAGVTEINNTVNAAVPAAVATTADVNSPAPLSAAALAVPTMTVLIEQPLPGDGFAIGASVVISGVVQAEQGLGTLSVTANGSEIYNEAWNSATLTETEWVVGSWTPGAAGVYEIVANLTDLSGSTTVSNTSSTGPTVLPTIIYVSDTPPQLTLSDAVNFINIADFLGDGSVAVMGTVTDADVGVQSVEARFDGQDWQPMVLNGSDWSGGVTYPANELGNGDSFTLSVRATDLAGQTTTLQQQVTVDLVPPTSFSAALSYDSGGGNFVPVGVNETVTDVLQPALRVEWEASSDPSGISDYTVTWYELLQDGALAQLQQETAVSGLTSSFSGAAEPQRLVVEIDVRDAAGNLRTVEAGPIYLDYEQTPAYIDMAEVGRDDAPYRNWIAESCNQLGVDYRLAELTQSDPQAFFATWDAAGLRLAWTGADWDQDGDLFIYLDTGAGGSDKAFVPSGWQAAEVWLPDGMQADYAVWVQDSGTAVLLSYDGSSWNVSGQSFDYVFDRNLSTPQTDLLLPFSAIGNASTLKLVAFASEQDALRLWSTMPVDNSLNSERVIAGANNRRGQQFALTNAYDWSNAGANGVCVSDGQTSGASLAFNVTTDPAAIGYALLNDGLFFAMPQIESGWKSWMPQSNPLDPDSLPTDLDFDPRGVLAGVVNVNTTPIGNGETADIVIGVTNRGPAASSGVTASISYSNLTGPATLTLPDLAAGGSGSATLTVQANSSSAAWGSADIAIQDVNGNTVEWIYVDVEIDSVAPSHVELAPAVAAVTNGVNDLFGAYVDQTAVTTLSINGQSCGNETAVQGQWACSVSLSGLTHGSTVNLPIEATDRFNQTSSTVSVPVLVDTQPPVITLGADTLAVFDDNILSRIERTFSGTATDGTSGVSVEVCEVNSGIENCQPASVGGQQDSPLIFAYANPTNGGSAACNDNALVQTFTVSDAFTVADLNVGLNLEHPYRVSIEAYLEAPDGTLVKLVDDGTGAANYALLLDDAALISLSSDFGDHDAAQSYTNVRQPAESLTAFNGKSAAGDWTLSVCDSEGAVTLTNTQLNFAARNAAPATDAAWSFSYEPINNVELENQVLRFYAVDQAGNRSAPVEFTYKLDTKPPVVTFVTPFNGTVTDGSGIDYMQIRYHTPDGETILDGIDVTGSDWLYELLNGLQENELYGVYVEATDNAGNYSEISPYEYINNNNLPPEANDDAYSTDEDTLLNITAPGLLANDTDDNGGLTTQLAGSPPSGSLLLRLDGSFVYNPSGAFDYLGVGESATDTFTYRVTDSGGETDEALVTIDITGLNDAPVLDELPLPEILEDDVLALSVDFTDPDLNDTHQVIIDWGDGTIDAPFNLVSGQRSFNRTHQYLDDDPSLTSVDSYELRITITDSQGATFVGGTSVRVSNVNPEIENAAVVDVNENGVTTFSGTIVDVGSQDTFTMTVDWGDGTAVDTYSYPAGTTLFSETHLYTDDNPAGTAADQYTITYTLRDDDVEIDEPSDPITATLVATTPLTVTNLPPWALMVDVSAQTVQYSDFITPVTVEATDVVGDPLLASTTWNLVGETPVAGLPGDLSLAAGSCVVSGVDVNLHTCSWELSGTAEIPAGDYQIDVLVSDDDLGETPITIDITIEPEDATATLDESNLVIVPVTGAGSNASVPFSLLAAIQEVTPDSAAFAADPGNINLAEATATLLPVDGSSPISALCTAQPVDPVTGYDDVLNVACDFSGVPVNAYDVELSVAGGFYDSVGDEDFLVVYDPSGGIETGAHALALDNCVVSDDQDTDFDQNAQLDCSILSSDEAKIKKDGFIGGNIISFNDITIEKDSTIEGDLIAAGSVTLKSGVVVNGTVQEGALVYQPVLPIINVNAGGADIKVEKNQTLTLEPGSYGKLEVEEGATVNFVAGQYLFAEVDVKKEVALNFDTTAGFILLSIEEKLEFAQDVVMTTTGEVEQILFEVADADVKFGKDGTYIGTYVAPRGHIDVEQGSTVTGALYGDKVQVKKDNVINGRPAIKLYFDLYIRPVFENQAPSVNELPTANAGDDQMLIDSDDDGSETVTLDGTASVDADGTIQSYSWSKNGVEIATGPTPTIVLDVGVHTLTLTVTDDEGAIASDEVVITIEAPLPTSNDLLYVSSSSGGTANGIDFDDEDILLFDTGSNSWSLYFDGSDVGLSGEGARDVDAFALLDDGSILLSFSGATTIPDVGSVDDSDIVRFVPTSTGTTTSGSYEMYLDGSDVGLTTNGEDIDAIFPLADDVLLVSTSGSFSVTGASGADEDLLRLDIDSTGADSSGTWSLYFDGSDVGLNNGGDEDVWGAWVDEATGDLYLSTRGAFAVDGLDGDGADIFTCSQPTTGSASACSNFELFWDGSANGLGGEQIDGFFVQR